MKNLMMLLKLRSWWKSKSLKGAGLVVMLGQAQVWLAGSDSAFLDPTLLAWGTSLVGLALLAVRTFTDRALEDK